MMNQIELTRGIGAAICILAAGVTLSANAAQAEVSFSGKRINGLIGSAPGGGTDGTTRLVGRYLAKYLPGNPTVVYRNMPAGHGVQAHNYFYKEAPNDGTYWMGGSSGHVDANQLRRSVSEYNPTHYEYIGGVARGSGIVSIRASKLPNLTDKSKPPVVVGAIDGSRNWAQMIQWGAEYLGWNVRFVIGYQGSGGLTLAAKRGEVDAFGTSSPEILRSIYAKGEFKGLAQLGERRGGKIVPARSWPDITVLPNVLADKITGRAKEAFEVWTKANQIDKFYILPPNADKAAVTAYRNAWNKLSSDPEFLRLGQKQFGDDFGMQTHEDIHDLITASAYPSVEVTKFLHDLKIKHGLPGTPLSAEEMTRIAIERGAVKKVTATLNDVKREGREIYFKNGDVGHMAKVRSDKTKLSIADKKVKRAALKAGMTCDVLYTGDQGEALAITCR